MQNYEKNKKDKMIQMKYPAPYSQSWAGMSRPRRSYTAEKTASKTANELESSGRRFPGGKPSMTQQRFEGLDPTAPHLKYGLFPKRIYINRGQSRILSVKPSVRAADVSPRMSSPRRSRCIIEPRQLKIERPAIAKASTVQKFLRNPQKAQGEPSVCAADVSPGTSSPRRSSCIIEPRQMKFGRPKISKAVQKFMRNSQKAQGEYSGPVFVFRPLEHRNLRSLTVSVSTHLDIKPRPHRGPLVSPQLYKRYL